MTVMQKTLRDNLAFTGLMNERIKTAEKSTVIKKIAYYAKVTLITLGSMSLSFYLVFLR